MEPIESRVISSDEEIALYDGKFILETVVPLVANPEYRTYRLTRDELESFFDYYHEYAEYIISVRREKA